MECMDPVARARLRTFADEMVDEPCRVDVCPHPDVHITLAHWCMLCSSFGGGNRCCPYATESVRTGPTFEVTCPTCRTTNMVDTSQIVHAAAECCVCLQSGPTVLFPLCRHATVCVSCTNRLR